MRPKRTKYSPHTAHCTCLLALEEALAALAELLNTSRIYLGVRETRAADAVLAKFGSFQKKGGQKPDAGAARNGPAASAEITENQYANHMQAMSRGGWEG